MMVEVEVDKVSTTFSALTTNQLTDGAVIAGMTSKFNAFESRS